MEIIAVEATTAIRLAGRRALAATASLPLSTAATTPTILYEDQPCAIGLTGPIEHARMVVRHEWHHRSCLGADAR
jgi:hypothetical protein